ncbi:MAG: hypothetical protein J6K52_01805 [Clostridia bacterium]|nr:hypothetical protein [Clostridia bacterium]
MKKKILITVAMCLVLAFSLALAVSAETCESCTFTVEVGTYYDVYTCTVCNTSHTYIKENYINDINGLVASYVNSNPIVFEKSKVFELMSEELKNVYNNNYNLEMQIENLLYLAENSYNTAILYPQCDDNHVIKVYETDGYYTGWCTCNALSIEELNSDIGYDLNNTWESFISTYVGSGDTAEVKNEYMEYLQTNNSDLHNAIQNIGYFDNIVSTFASAYVYGLENGDKNLGSQMSSAWNAYLEECSSTETAISEQGFMEYLGTYNSELKSIYETSLANIVHDIVARESVSNSGSSGSDGSGEGNVTSGANYEQGHESENFYIYYSNGSLSDPMGCHYMEGYRDGAYDGMANYKASADYTNSIEAAKIEAVENYKISEEHITAMNQIRSEGVQYGIEQYKNSVEYTNTLSSEYASGVSAGYDAGYAEAGDVAYKKGVLAGMAQAPDGWSDKLTETYQDGYMDGYDYAKDSSSDAPSVVGIIMAIIALLGISALGTAIYTKIRKNKRKFK